MKMRLPNARAIALAAATVAGFLLVSPQEAKASCVIMYYPGTAGTSPGNTNMGPDDIWYNPADLRSPNQTDCNQATANAYASQTCLDWNIPAQLAVAENRRQLATGQVVTLTHYGPTATWSYGGVTFGKYAFGTTQCTYFGAGNVTTTPSVPPLTFTPRDGGRFGSYNGIVGTGSNNYGPIPGLGGGQGSADAGDSSTPRDLN